MWGGVVGLTAWCGLRWVVLRSVRVSDGRLEMYMETVSSLFIDEF